MTHIIQSIAVTHNAEAAHRLYLTPGKCEQIHGHSFQIAMELFGAVDDKGMVAGLNFTDVKKSFREHIDLTYDHKLLLNVSDPVTDFILPEERENSDEPEVFNRLPGVVAFDGDPTTENIARWVGEWAVRQFATTEIGSTGIYHIEVLVRETATNAASWSMGA